MSKDSNKKSSYIPLSSLSSERKKAEIRFFKPSIDIDEIKSKKELDYFRRSRRGFLRFIFAILILHNFITILLIGGVVLMVFLGEIRVSLNVIIPAYFVNVTVQVFALMKAVVQYFDKEDFIQRY